MQPRNQSSRLDARLGATGAPQDEHDALTPLVEVAEALRRTAALDAPSASAIDAASDRLRAAVRQQRAAMPAVARPANAPIRFMRSPYARFALSAAAALLVVGFAVRPSAMMRPAYAFGALFSGESSTKVEVRLVPAVGVGEDLASGRAKGEQRPDRTRFAVEVEDVSNSSGLHSVRVTRAGVPVPDSAGLTMNVDALGFGELELNTQDGDTVPVVLAGDLVEVLNPASEVILSGTLVTK